MRVVHRVRGKARLEQVPAPAFAEVDMAGIAPVRLAQHGAQAIGGLGHQDQVDVVIHQAPGQAVHRAGPRALYQKIEVEAAVLVTEKHRQPPITALGNVVRNAGQDYAGETGH
jgi:hypothetical protein